MTVARLADRHPDNVEGEWNVNTRRPGVPHAFDRNGPEQPQPAGVFPREVTPDMKWHGAPASEMHSRLAALVERT